MSAAAPLLNVDGGKVALDPSGLVRKKAQGIAAP
jgi:hypothetical protein